MVVAFTNKDGGVFLYIYVREILLEPQECKGYFKQSAQKHLPQKLLITEYLIFKYYKDKDLLVFYSEDDQE